MDDAARPEALRTQQYHDAERLEARMRLHQRFSVNPQGWSRWLFEQLGLQAGSQILELGCGAASLWRDNAERVPPTWRVLLSDFSPGMLEDARAAVAATGLDFDFEVIDARSIPYSEARFDAVLANHMLYHVPERPRALAEIRRVLRPGGRFVASTLAGAMDEIGAIVRRVTLRNDFSLMRMASVFTLDNGAEQLAPFFGQIEVRRYVDALEITEVEPLLDYLRSLIQDDPFDDVELESIGAAALQVIREHGALRVEKDAGVLLAKAPEEPATPR